MIIVRSYALDPEVREYKVVSRVGDKAVGGGILAKCRTFQRRKRANLVAQMRFKILLSTDNLSLEGCGIEQ